jgi:hypothetical protein
VGGLNEIQVYRTNDFSKVTTIPVGKLPHGIWPSGDGTRSMCDCDEPHRPSRVGGSLRAQGHSGREREWQLRDDDNAGRPRTSWNREPAAARRRRAVDPAVASAARAERGQGTHQHFAIRPGLSASAGGLGHWARTGKAASGHAAALPNPATNCRLFIESPRRRWPTAFPG